MSCIVLIPLSVTTVVCPGMSLNTTLELLCDIPRHTTVVTESGISTRQDIELMLERGVYCFLVGEALMRQPNPGAALAGLFDLR